MNYKSGSSIGAVILGFILWKVVGLPLLVAAIISFIAWPLFAGIFGGIGALFAGKGPTLYRVNEETGIKGMSVIFAFLREDLPELSGEAFKSFFEAAFLAALNAAKTETGDGRLFTVANKKLPVRVYYGFLKSFSKTQGESFGRACGLMMEYDDLDWDNVILEDFKYTPPGTNEVKNGGIMILFNKSVLIAETEGEDVETIKQKALPEFSINIPDNGILAVND